MLIDIKILTKKYNFTPSGILHVGAHKAEELACYKEIGVSKVAWVEANEELCELMRKNLSAEADNVVLNYLVSDVDDAEYDFKITNNGESSSILELGTHEVKHPQVFVTDVKKLTSKTLSTIFLENELDFSNYDFLNLDIQGAELLALKGLGDNIKNFKYIYTEVNVDYLYKECALMGEIDEYLGGFGFSRADTYILERLGWGDAFYIKN